MMKNSGQGAVFMIDRSSCEKYLRAVFEDVPSRIVLSKPPHGSEFVKIRVLRTDKGYMFEKLTQKQVFHENHSEREALERCLELLSEGWSQLNAWGERLEFSLSVSKKGKLLFGKRLNTHNENKTAENPHNRKKELYHF